MKARPQSAELLEALVLARGIIDEEPATAPWVKRLRKVVQAGIEKAAGPDPLLKAAVALVKSVQVLEAELQAARQALKAGEIWVCKDTPELLEAARAAIAEAKAAGVSL